MATKKVKDGYELVTTDSGFTCEVEVEALNDMRVLNLIRKIEGTTEETEQVFLFNDLAHLILSDKEYARLENHVAKDNGRIPVDALYKEFTQIFTHLKSAKN